MSKNEPKQVIVVRKDLNMRKGKIAAQASHASLGAILNYSEIYLDATIDYNDGYHNYASQLGNCAVIQLNKQPLKEWLEGRFTKVCVSVDSEQELLDIYQKALDNKVNVKLIKDAGLTEFNGIPTLTCLALGPDYPENIDPITGHLKLL
jgi:PTH2 family peptidyl-tRNA hydrolase